MLSRPVRPLVAGLVVVLLMFSTNMPIERGQAENPERVEGLVPRDSSGYLSSPSIQRYVTFYKLPRAVLAPLGIGVRADGFVWFVESNASVIARLTVEDGTITEYSLPGVREALESWNIVFDATGTLWFADAGGNSIWSFDPSSLSFNRYEVPTSSALPLWVLSDAQGSLWFTELQGNKIGRLDPKRAMPNTSEGIEEFEIPTKNAGPAQITFGPDGRIWFTESFSKKIGVFDPRNPSFREYEVPTSLLSPIGIAVDLERRVWIADHGSSKLVGFNPSTNTVEEYSTSTPRGSYPVSLPYWLRIDDKGNIWFNEHTGGKIARFIPSDRVLVEYHVSGEDAWPLSFDLDSSGNVWFTEFNGNMVGIVNSSRPLPYSLVPSTRNIATRIGDTARVELTVLSTISEPLSLSLGSSTPLEPTGRVTNASVTFSVNPLNVPGRSSARASVELSVAQSHPTGQFPIMLTSSTGEVTYSTLLQLKVEGRQDYIVLLTAMIAAIGLLAIGIVLIRFTKRPKRHQ